MSVEKIGRYVDIGKKEGARLVLGGEEYAVLSRPLLAGPRPIPAPKPVEPEPAAVVIVAKSEDASAAARKAWETRRARAAARRSHR